MVWTVTIKCAACTPRQEKQTIGQWGSFMEWLTALPWTHLLFSLKMCPTLENIRKTSDKNSWRNWPLLWSFHMHVRDWKCSKQRKMWNKSFAVVAFYRYPHQLQAPPSVIQHSARDATFVPDERTRKPNSSVVSAITLCAKSTANGCCNQCQE